MSGSIETVNKEDFTAGQLREVFESSGRTSRYGRVRALKQQKEWEEPSKEPARTCSPSKGIRTWKVFKFVLIVTCLVAFLFLSKALYPLYFKFPVTASVKVTTPAIIMFPAITVCGNQAITRTRFCAKHPHLCQKPDKVNEFCRKHPHFCKGGTSSLVIPKLGYYTSSNREEVRDAVLQMTHDGGPSVTPWHYTQRAPSEWKKATQMFHIQRFGGALRSTVSKTMLVEENTLRTYGSCQSWNVHLSDGIPTTVENKLNKKIPFHQVTIQVSAWESLFSWMALATAFSVHSPFIPVNPLEEGQSLKLGYQYDVYVRVEEEHLLPEPYQTNCEDYEALWRKNKASGPRSQEMCRDLCKVNFTRHCADCDAGLTMLETSKNICLEDVELMCKKTGELWKSRKRCIKDCKPSCLNLKYSFTTAETEADPFENQSTGEKYVIFINIFKERSDVIVLNFYLEKPDVTVVSYNPLYEKGELLSHIGSLIACCLGISVWVLNGIIERTYRAASRLMKKGKKSGDGETKCIVSEQTDSISLQSVQD